MYRFNVSVSVPPPRAGGPKAAELIRMFGIPRCRLERPPKTLCLNVEIDAGQIVLITGPSGAGKSVLLNALYEKAPAEERLRLEEIVLDGRLSAIDGLAQEDTGLHACLEAMNKAALSDVFCMLCAPAQMSVGEQARYKLAKSLVSNRRLLFADEFTASMDRITALAAAYHLRKAITRSGKSVILASCHEDLIEELRPDNIIRL